MQILTINEMSEILRVKPKTLYQWAELGQIPSIKMNGALRFDMDDVMPWLKNCKKDPSNGYNSTIAQTARCSKKGVKKG